MFIHYQRRGKCEWYEGLADFVADYNRKHGTEYVRSDCLDVKRTGGHTEQQPEVLVTDQRTGAQMVIERKSVVWPPTYVRQHQNDHEFAEAIWQSTKGRFQDGCYELKVSAKELNSFDRNTILRIASEIGSVLAQLDSSKIVMRRSTPVHWTFRPADQYEYEDRRGIAIVHEDPMALEDFVGNGEASAGTATAMEQQLAAAAPKFAGYPNARKVVLLEFYGGTLSEEDIPPLMPKIAVPDCIHEIWMTKRDWVSEDNYEIGFERLFVQSA